MKILKALDKKVGDTEYYRYRINLPKKVVEDSKLFNKKLKVKNDDDKIIIEKE